MSNRNPIGGAVTFAEPKPRPVAASAPTTAVAKGIAPQPAANETSQLNMKEHLMTPREVMQAHNVVFNEEKPLESAGLGTAQALERLANEGPNQLSPPKKRHPFLKFLDILFGLFNLMLIISGVASYVTYSIDTENNFPNVYIGAILLVVALMNAFIDFYQQQKSQSILESFLHMIPSRCYAIRDGQLGQINAVDLVKGDVVYVRMGDKIPADLWIFQATDFKVDNSSLTGETEPQERMRKNVHTNPLEATNLAFNSTLCVNGDAYGVVIRTGDHTVIGQIASLTANEERRPSPLSDEINTFVKTIAGVAATVAVVFFIVAMTVRASDPGNGAATFSVALNFAIGTFVSFVPEGLPATVTMLLTIAAKRMATRQVLVKDLQGVETLGAITLLATDKTGTLTRNQMTVTYIWTAFELYYAQNLVAGSDESKHAKAMDMQVESLNEIQHISCLCAKARFESTTAPIAQRIILGDATESGLLRCAATHVEGIDDVYTRFPKVFEIPFNSTNKWAMTIHRKPHANGELMLYIKGAPERILRLCTTIFDGTHAKPMTDEDRAAYEKTYAFMAGKGHRVLAFAALKLDGQQYPADYAFTKDPVNYPTDQLTFYGLVSLEDPPKHGVREAIGHCREAGVKVMMVTGDHPLTAEAIGRKINLMVNDTKEMMAAKTGRAMHEIPEHEVHAIVIHGEVIDGLTDADWNTIFLKDEIIFARTSPTHKLEIVKRAQAAGHLVGVTGDGVNDSPALKKADLGIAMNVSGSDVSKEAAAMVLLDDNFASTVVGIEEGRLIFQNLKKSVQYTVSHTMPEVWANLLYIALPLPLPLSAVQILVVDLGFELCMALSYAWDPAESQTGLMKLPPRKPVTPDSRARKARDDAEAEEALRRDTDAQGVHHPPNALVRAGRRIRACFSSQAWARTFEPTDDETLVDRNLLSYSYLEIGTLMTIGCLTSYFFSLWWAYSITPADAVKYGAKWGAKNAEPIRLGNGRMLDQREQADALVYGQSAYYLAIMFQQCFNLMLVKARLGYPFGRFMIANKRNFVGMLLGASVCFAVVYIPPFNTAFGTRFRLSPITWLPALLSGMIILLYGTLRVYVKRCLFPTAFYREITGLMMYPTAWSNNSKRA
ncbi:hypothetical protein CXG81DRAFT_15445 [Caulochytrium protostelioides]|uniref:Cation-transporting P-type ATPase N-terminal domain-containing protein n=1 Tax=Caulochytrium protostelioides TaxID=1555241 RepID=A0A4P9WWS6_9FUNG|nr:hypothetical protein CAUPRSCDRAFT_5899 [Caulochytrium protostelioides]RKO98786.1 hypothetical protein CXG81DRAFT_15445 [Caulochytrium protostelioides]|eukprot:RKO98786.1 hypothetical protein CXG81DRAFT_15445 [Caulochytrium protostelioides]